MAGVVSHPGEMASELIHLGQLVLHAPLLELLLPDPKVIAVSPSLFPRIGDDEPTQQLSGDGNAFFESYQSTFLGDPTATLVKWGNRPPPSSPPAGGTCPARRPCQTASPGATQTDYPV
jgi:hypothetical protein